MTRTTLGGYELLEEIGRGGMGIVYKARQIALDRIVALKMLRGGLPVFAEDSVRFRAEAAAVARLRHPNIVQIYEVGERDGQPYLALEYVAGGTLSQRLSGHPLAPLSAAALIESLARALDHAHNQGIIHRNLKPANVLMAGENGETHPSQATSHCPLDTVPKIADFGLAKFINAPDGPTRTGALLGTPSYMAPEQTTGDAASVGPAADIYALGAILYECLTGRPPFRAPTLLETLEQVRTDEPVSVRTIQPRTPRDLETICLTCLRKEPTRRYASASELADDLHRFQAGESISARRTGIIERTHKWIRRRPAQAAIVGLGIAAAISAFIGVSVHNRLLRAEADRADSEKRRAADHYREARNTLRQVLVHGAPSTVRSTSRVTDVRLRQLEDAIAFYRAAANADKADPEVRYDLASAHLAAAIELSLQSRLDRVEPHLLNGRTILEKLVAAQPDNFPYRRSLGLCYSNLGFLHDKLGHRDLAQQSHFKALTIREQLAAENTGDPLRNRPLAETLLNLGNGSLARDDVREAEAYYRRATELWVQDHQARPDEAYAAVSLAECKISLGLLTLSHERLEEATAHYKEIESLLQPLTDHPTIGLHSASALASANVNFANLLRTAKRTQEMLDRFARAEKLLDSVDQREPTWSNGRDTRFAMHGARAQALIELNRHAEALRDWDRAVSVALNDQQRNQIAVLRMFTRINLGDYATATDEAAAIATRRGLDGTNRYNLACIYSRAIPLAKADRARAESNRESCAEYFAKQAMACLTECRTIGFFKDPANVTNMQNDSDLASLKARPDYQSFASDLTVR